MQKILYKTYAKVVIKINIQALTVGPTIQWDVQPKTIVTSNCQSFNYAVNAWHSLSFK